jgi:hypothetical protein
MLDSGESQKEVIRPDFNRAIMIDFQGATITSNVGFLLLREIDDRFKIIAPMGDSLEDPRSSTHSKHSLVQMIRQSIYQIGAGDAFLSVTALAAALKAPDEVLGFIGNVVGALAVEIMGNRKSIDKQSVKNLIVSLLK